MAPFRRAVAHQNGGRQQAVAAPQEFRRSAPPPRRGCPAYRGGRRRLREPDRRRESGARAAAPRFGAPSSRPACRRHRERARLRPRGRRGLPPRRAAARRCRTGRRRAGAGRPGSRNQRRERAARTCGQPRERSGYRTGPDCGASRPDWKGRGTLGTTGRSVPSFSHVDGEESLRWTRPVDRRVNWDFRHRQVAAVRLTFCYKNILLTIGRALVQPRWVQDVGGLVEDRQAASCPRP